MYIIKQYNMSVHLIQFLFSCYSLILFLVCENLNWPAQKIEGMIMQFSRIEFYAFSQNSKLIVYKYINYISGNKWGEAEDEIGFQLYLGLKIF